MYSFLKEFSTDVYKGRKKTEWILFGISQLIKLHEFYGLKVDNLFKQRLSCSAKYKCIKNDTIVLDFGQKTDFFAFLIDGDAIECSEYFGTKKIEMLYTSGSVLTSYVDFITYSPSSVQVVTTNKCHLLYFDSTAFEMVTNDDPDGSYKKFTNNFFSDFVQFRQNILKLQYLPNKEKVEFLYENYPIIFSRFSLKNIAAFLGMEPETISRMRAKMK